MCVPSVASDEKGGDGHALSSIMSSSHQALYMDWRDDDDDDHDDRDHGADYDRKCSSSYDKDSLPGGHAPPRHAGDFPKSHSFQHMAAPSPQKGGRSPSYTRTASCYSEPYHSPRLTSSHSVASAQARLADSRASMQVGRTPFSFYVYPSGLSSKPELLNC